MDINKVLSREDVYGKYAWSIMKKTILYASSLVPDVTENFNDIDELMEDIEYGVYACGSRGGQVDTGRGSFQFAAQEAYLIENGEITTPLRDVSVSGLTLQILNDVDGLTKDAKLASPGFCGKGQTVPVGDGGPIMRIREALVG